MKRIALTFGDADKNHIGNQMLGKNKWNVLYAMTLII